MVVVTGVKGFKVLSIKGAFGTSAGLGMHSIGQSEVGDVREETGIYRMHPQVRGRGFQLMVSYRTSNPRTIPQQNNRIQFADIVKEWQDLPEITKNEWRKKASKKSRPGYHYFISRRMKGLGI